VAAELVELTEPIDPSLLAALGPIPRLKARSEAVRLGTPLIGSDEYRDRLLTWGGAEVGSVAIGRIASAIDHLYTWQRIILGGSIPAFSGYSLLRPVFEGSVQARWVLDSAETSETRTGRGAGVRLADLNWRSKLEADLATDSTWMSEPTFKAAGDRMTEIRDGAAKHGIQCIRLLDTAELMRRYAIHTTPPDVVWFRVTSGVMHGQIWSASLAEVETVSTGATMSTMKLTANQGIAAVVTAVAVRHIEAAVDALEAYVEPMKVVPPSPSLG
jgi:hypothetical protein